MSIEILTRQPIKFIEKHGVQYFEPFEAVDNMNKPVNVFLEATEPATKMVAKNFLDSFSRCDLSIDSENKSIYNKVLMASPAKRGMGEILNLASIIEFHKNKFKNLSLHSYKESVPYFSQYGFRIDSDYEDLILDGLVKVIKSKSPDLQKIRDEAYALYPYVYFPEIKDPEILRRSCDTISEYLKQVVRARDTKENISINSFTKMMFEEADLEKNKDYLNTLLDKHKINYQI